MPPTLSRIVVCAYALFLMTQNPAEAPFGYGWEQISTSVSAAHCRAMVKQRMERVLGRRLPRDPGLITWKQIENDAIGHPQFVGCWPAGFDFKGEAR